FVLLLARTYGRLLATRGLAAARGGATRRRPGAVSTDPDVAFVVDRNAVVGIRPVIALPWSAPTRNQIAFLVKLQHGRCGRAALRYRWIRRRMHLACFKRTCTMDDPDMILSVYRNADGLAENPMIRERLRP